MVDAFDYEDRGLTIAIDREAERETDGPEAPPRQADDPAANQEQADRRKSQRTGYPDELAQRYYVVPDKNGDVNRVYADSKGERELFRDYGEELRTKQADQAAVKAMLDTAQHRGWDNIALRGSKDFRREAWLEASARGVAVRGYEPTELDRQELARREQPFLKNEIRNGEVVERDRERTTERQAPVRVDYRAGIKGVVIDIGKRAYRDDPKATPSSYVELALDSGERHTAWGSGLPDALERAGAQKGDRIALREAGKETVKVPVQKQVDGHPVVTETSVQRRSWEARTLERTLDREIDRNVPSIGGENSRDAGRNRDLGSDGADVNEKRARQYLEHGRRSAEATPELKAAATMESYFERKLKRDFKDPAQVRRGMIVVRETIADLIREGAEFPEPRITDHRAKQFEADKARGQEAGERTREPAAPQRPRQRQRDNERSR